ncbi:MAG: hypothetical protein IJV31_07220 [Clostridia bacterium]|nr:hypothetical protein [Clostridia bacterium]
MYKRISKNEKITRKISEVHYADNYLTKETTENISLAITKLNGKLDSSKIINERVYYFISADVDFIIDDEKVHCESGDVLYLDKDTSYSAEGEFEAITINVPVFGVIK